MLNVNFIKGSEVRLFTPEQEQNFERIFEFLKSYCS